MIIKNHICFLLFFLLLACGCGKARLQFIPEISPPLIQKEVFSWTGQAAANTLFACAEGIGWVDLSGQIVTWNAEKEAAGKVFRLPYAVSDRFFRQNDFLVLKNQAADQWLVFDLARMETSFELRNMQVKQVLGVNSDYLVYLDEENLVVYGRQNPVGIRRWPTAEKEFFNCHFFLDRVLIMSRSQLFIFWKSNGKFQPLPLPLQAAAEFYCQGEYVFYGSSQRQLVKYSLREKRLVWKLKLGKNLMRQPLAFAENIIVNPEDNNVLQLNPRGTVRWWLALHSIPQFNLLPMTDCLAAFLINQEIQFIDLRRRQLTTFKITGRPAGIPLAYHHDLYFFLTAGKMKKLQRVGNRYGIDVTLSPEKTQMPGIPITFSVVTSNLLEPNLNCVIRDESGQTVMTKTIAMAARTSLAWIPAREGIYRLHVSAAALNRNEEKEISFQVFDPRKIIREFYFHF